MKIATCTPYPFSGEPRFFTRDTGLLCRGLQACGHDCVVVMPGTSDPQEPDDLIRCGLDDLADANWWRKLDRECVILYAWGDPRYLDVARAIRKAGIVLIQSLDTAGLYTPYGASRDWLRATREEMAIPNPLPIRARRLGRFFRDFAPFIFESKRLEMMAESDYLAAVSLPAADSIRSYAKALNRPDVSDKVVIIPHAVSPAISYHGEEKKKHLVVVGRWGSEDAPQKDPQLTLRVVSTFLDLEPEWEASIIGPAGKRLLGRAINRIQAINWRIQFHDFLPHHELHLMLAKSRILLCASRFESFHIASAEAVCAGCSVVVPDSALLASTHWFTTSDSGTVARSRDFEDLIDALRAEAANWDTGLRDPFQISKFWRERLHADKLETTILDLFEKHPISHK